MNNLHTQIAYIGDVTAAAGSCLPFRLNQEYELVYFPHGTTTFYQRPGGQLVLSQPCFLVIRPEEAHQFRFCSKVPTRHLYVHFRANASLSATKLLSEAYALFHFPPALASLLELLIHIAVECQPDWQDRCNALLVALLTELNYTFIRLGAGEKRTSLLPIPLKSTLDWINQELDRPITMEEMADHAGYSPKHLARLFNQHLGMTPQTLLKHIRMERACVMLNDEGRTIKSIALACGYLDEHSFSRSFKKIKGVSPLHFRNSIDKKDTHHLIKPKDWEQMHRSRIVFPDDTKI